MNLLCHKHKLQETKGDVEVKDNISYIKKTIIIDHKVLDSVRKFEAQGTGKNKREAT